MDLLCLCKCELSAAAARRYKVPWTRTRGPVSWETDVVGRTTLLSRLCRLAWKQMSVAKLARDDEFPPVGMRVCVCYTWHTRSHLVKRISVPGKVSSAQHDHNRSMRAFVSYMCKLCEYSRALGGPMLKWQTRLSTAAALRWRQRAVIEAQCYIFKAVPAVTDVIACMGGFYPNLSPLGSQDAIILVELGCLDIQGVKWRQRSFASPIMPEVR
jgi:hypothetical protein